jgi:hypothetical protein
MPDAITSFISRRSEGVARGRGRAEGLTCIGELVEEHDAEDEHDDKIDELAADFGADTCAVATSAIQSVLARAEDAREVVG